ncbi:hypothetical protein EDC04DRAFT_643267 [Pisolithus marmoratus]|nr:hypothetical protein EDC04DRAFT_643267 [Pisolithus marmoratus]
MGYGATVATSALVPPAVLGLNVYFPPYLQRVGFSCVSVVQHMSLQLGTIEVVVGLLLTLKAPRHPLTLAMASGAAGCAALYGTEYFIFQD